MSWVLGLYIGAAFTFVSVLALLVIWQTIRELKGVSRAALEEKLAELDALEKRPVRSDERIAERERDRKARRDDALASKEGNKRGEYRPRAARATQVLSDDALAEKHERGMRHAGAKQAREERAIEGPQPDSSRPSLRDDALDMLSSEEREYEDIGMATRGVTRLDVLGR